MKRAGARGGDLEVRGHAAVRVDLQRGQRQDRVLDVGSGRTFERGIEEPGVRDRLFDVPIRGHDEQRHAPVDPGGSDRRERLRCRGQPGRNTGKPIEAS
jgi:hypothetical protein